MSDDCCINKPNDIPIPDTGCEQCPEILNSICVIYQGESLGCETNPDVITSGMNLEQVFANIINLICTGGLQISIDADAEAISGTTTEANVTVTETTPGEYMFHFDFVLQSGQDGTNGLDGNGWTGGSYDPNTGVVTFTSTDGLGFITGDLRGTDGQDGQDGADGVCPPCEGVDLKFASYSSFRIDEMFIYFHDFRITPYDYESYGGPPVMWVSQAADQIIQEGITVRVETITFYDNDIYNQLTRDFALGFVIPDDDEYDDKYYEYEIELTIRNNNRQGYDANYTNVFEFFIEVQDIVSGSITQKTYDLFTINTSNGPSSLTNRKSVVIKKIFKINKNSFVTGYIDQGISENVGLAPFKVINASLKLIK